MGFVMIKLTDRLAYLVGGFAQHFIWILITCFVYVNASWQSLCYYLASGFVENRFFDTWFCGAKGLIIAVCCIQWRNITIPD